MRSPTHGGSRSPTRMTKGHNRQQGSSSPVAKPVGVNSVQSDAADQQLAATAAALEVLHASSPPAVRLGAECGTLLELLDIVNELLLQHEVRLSLALLDTVRACQPIAATPLVAAGWDISRLFASFVNSERNHCHNDRTLNALEKRLACRGMQNGASVDVAGAMSGGLPSSGDEVCSSPMPPLTTPAPGVSSNASERMGPRPANNFVLQPSPSSPQGDAADSRQRSLSDSDKAAAAGKPNSDADLFQSSHDRPVARATVAHSPEAEWGCQVQKTLSNASSKGSESLSLRGGPAPAKGAVLQSRRSLIMMAEASGGNVGEQLGVTMDMLQGCGGAISLPRSPASSSQASKAQVSKARTVSLHGSVSLGGVNDNIAAMNNARKRAEQGGVFTAHGSHSPLGLHSVPESISMMNFSPGGASDAPKAISSASVADMEAHFNESKQKMQLQKGATNITLSPPLMDEHLDNHHEDDFDDTHFAERFQPTGPISASPTRRPWKKAAKAKDSSKKAIENQKLRKQGTKGPELGPDDMTGQNGQYSHEQVVPTGPWIIHPNSTGRLCWDCAGLMFIVAEAYLVPLSLGFDIEADSWWFWATTSYFGSDIFTQFFTGYYLGGALVMKQSAIAKNYVTGYFTLDVAATMPWEHLISGMGWGASLGLMRIARVGKLLRVFRLLRVLRLRDLMNRIEDILPSASVALVLSLVKMLLLFSVVCHWAACAWGFLGSPDKIGDSSKDDPAYDLSTCEPGGPCEPGIVGSPWIRRYGLQKLSPDTQYLIALQFSSGLVTGADMGMLPAMGAERVYVLSMIIGSFFFCSLMLSQIVVVVEQMSRSKAELTQRIRCAKEFMNCKKVPRTLQAKVRRYLEYEHEMSKEAQLQNTEFVNKLSNWIRLELLEHIHREIVCSFPFFADMARPVLQRVCGAAVTVLCAPGDIVVHRGHRAVGICWLVQGLLEIRGKPSETCEQGYKPKVLEAVSFIGENCLFMDMTWPNTAISMGHSELLMLTREALLSLLLDFPKSFKVYEEYRDRVSASYAAGLIDKGAVAPVTRSASDCAMNSP